MTPGIRPTGFRWGTSVRQWRGIRNSLSCSIETSTRTSCTSHECSSRQQVATARCSVAGSSNARSLARSMLDTPHEGRRRGISGSRVGGGIEVKSERRWIVFDRREGRPGRSGVDLRFPRTGWRPIGRVAVLRPPESPGSSPPAEAACVDLPTGGSHRAGVPGGASCGRHPSARDGEQHTEGRTLVSADTPLGDGANLRQRVLAKVARRFELPLIENSLRAMYVEHLIEELLGDD